ncbi:MAG: hypothetical protein ACREUV_07020 [Burkholderiales bacterium]
MRHLLKIISRFTLGLTLFAQLSLAAHACTLVNVQPASAFDASVSAPCHQASQFDPNACLAHCTESSQTASNYTLPALPAATLPVLSVALMETRAAPQAFSATQPLDHSDPPSTIRFCCFLN